MIKISVKNCWKTIHKNDELLILLIIEKALNRKVQLVDMDEAEMILLYGFQVKNYQFKLLNKFIMKLDNNKNNFNLLFGIPRNKLVLAISHENLDSPAWHWFGSLLIKYGIPRLTFWPKSIDPFGCQFPYWYNYLNFEDLNLPDEYYHRFGEPLEIKKLMSPLPKSNDNREDAVCVLASHLDFPRNYQIENLKKYKKVVIYGSIGEKWTGAKIDLLKKYKYCFCAENSSGYGYETEKVPEAWHAGCIPVGYIPSQPSEFNPNILSILFENENNIYQNALLNTKPTLAPIIEYIQKIYD